MRAQTLGIASGERRFQGCEAFDRGGRRLGPVIGMWVTSTDEPLLVAIDNGDRGPRVVPLAGASQVGKRLVVAFSEEQIREAPSVAEHASPTPDEIHRLGAHYGVPGLTSDPR